MTDNTYRAPSEYLDTEPAPDLLPPEMWSFMYLVYGPNVLNSAVKVNPLRVAEIFASQKLRMPPLWSPSLNIHQSRHLFLEFPLQASPPLMVIHQISVPFVPSW